MKMSCKNFIDTHQVEEKVWSEYPVAMETNYTYTYETGMIDIVIKLTGA